MRSRSAPTTGSPSPTASPEADVVIAGDVCYEREMSVRALAWLRSHADAGRLVLLGDPGRNYFSAQGLEELRPLRDPDLAAARESGHARDGRLAGAASSRRQRLPQFLNCSLHKHSGTARTCPPKTPKSDAKPADFASLYEGFNAPVSRFDCGRKCAPLNDGEPGLLLDPERRAGGRTRSSSTCSRPAPTCGRSSSPTTTRPSRSWPS